MNKNVLAKKIIEIINTVDPFGLIDRDTVGSKDEYASESKIIADSVEKNLPINILREKIKQIFVDQFEDDSLFSIKQYEKIADLIRKNDLL